MGTSANDIDIGIGVHANGDAEQLLAQLRTSLAGLREELVRVSEAQTQYSATADRMRNSTTGRFVSTDEARRGAQEAVTGINTAIGAYVQLGKTIDASNALAVKAFREEGDAIAAYLAQLGATEAQLNKVGAAIARVEQRAGGARVGGPAIAPGVGGVAPLLPSTDAIDNATKKIQVFGNAADATFTRVPRGARTAANAFTTMAFAVDGGSTSMIGMIRSAGGLAFGLSQLSTSANVVAGAAGIGALVIVVGTLIQLFHGGTEGAQKQAEALKSLGDSAEGVKHVKEAVDELRGSMQNVSGFRIDLLPIVGQTEAERKALEQLDAARQKLRSPGFISNQVAIAINAKEALGKLRDELASGTITQAQYNAELERMGRVLQGHRDVLGLFSRQLRDAVVQGADFVASMHNVAQASSEVAKAQEDVKRFGPAPDLAKRLDDVNQQFLALKVSGASGVEGIKDTQKAVEIATEQWFKFTQTEQGAKFAGIGFQDAMLGQGDAAKKAGPEVTKAAASILSAAKSIVSAEQIVEGGVALGDRARAEAQKASQQTIARLQGDAAARRRAADDEFANAKRDIERAKGLASDKNRALAAIEQQHRENLLKIDKDEHDKLVALDERLNDERIQADARFSGDAFDQRLAAARKQFDADIKAINDLKLNERQAYVERLAAENVFTANRVAIERERRDKLTEIVAATQKQLDQATSGDVSIDQIKAQFREQLNVINATLASPTSSAASKQLAEIGKRNIEALIPIEFAKARVADFEHTIEEAQTRTTTELQRISTELEARTLTQRDARVQIVDALTRERDAIRDVLPMLATEANLLPGNEQAQEKLDTYRLKLLQLNLEIAKVGDQFFELKRDSIDALQSGLAEGIFDTISGVRQLDQAWASAALSIVQQIGRITSAMLAQLAVQKLLSFFSGPTGDVTDAILSQGIPGVQFAAPKHWTGGIVNGPLGVDRVPGWLTAGEYIFTTEAVQRLGREWLDAHNYGAAVPERHYATGGLVTPAIIESSPASASSRVESDLRVWLDRGVMAEFLASSDGQELQLRNLQRNGRQVRSLFGRGR